jgi:hypothetical protein
MPRRVIALVLALAGCAAPAPPEPTAPRTKARAVLAADAPDNCPFWHSPPLKEVSVAYGLIPPSDEKDRAVANLDYWPGGCVLGSDDMVLVCPKCRACWWPKEKCWRYEGGALPPNFSCTFLRDFPLASTGTAIDTPTYGVVLTKDGEAKWAWIRYDTTESYEEVKARVAAYLNACALPVAHTIELEDFLRETSLRAEANFDAKVCYFPRGDIFAQKGATRVFATWSPHALR